MLEFTSLHLQNYAIWRDVTFDFEPGLTFVHGTNRSGKSALLKAMRPVLFGSDLVPQGGHITWTGANAGQRLMLEAHRRGKTNRYAVQVDGQAQHAERIADGRDLIDGLIGIPESLFDSTILLDGTNKHPLAQGKSSQRLDWIYEILAFASYYESQARRVDALLKPVNKQASSAVVLREQIRALRPPTPPSTDTSVEDLQTELDTLRAAVRALDAKVYQIEAVLNVDIEKPARRAGAVQTELEAVDNEYIALLETKRVWEQQAAQLERLERLDSAVRTTRAAYREACAQIERKPANPERAIPKLLEWIKAANRNLDHAAENDALWADQASTRALIQRTPTHDRSLAWLDREIERERENVAVARRTASAHNGTETTCSLCGSDLSDRVAHARRAAKELRRAQDALAVLQVDRDIVHARTLEGGLVSRAGPQHLATLRTNLQQLGAALEAAEAYAAATTRRADAGDTTVVAEPNLDRIKHLSQQRRDLQGEYARAAAYEGLMRGLRGNPYADYGVDRLNAVYAKARRLQRERGERITTLQDQLIRAQTAAALHDEYTRSAASLRTAFAEVRGAITDQKVLRELKAVFGRDGLPARRLETGLELFVEGLNQYAPLVWNEPYKFDIVVGPRRCDIIAHRNREATSINNTMSGSEQRGWQLVSALALLRILPPSSRANTIVLDELEANSDDATRHRYVREGIPEVCKMVPQVVVVSPLDRKHLPVQCNREFVVHKRAGRSTLQRVQ